MEGQDHAAADDTARNRSRGCGSRPRDLPRLPPHALQRRLRVPTRSSFRVTADRPREEAQGAHHQHPLVESRIGRPFDRGCDLSHRQVRLLQLSSIWHGPITRGGTVAPVFRPCLLSCDLSPPAIASLHGERYLCAPSPDRSPDAFGAGRER